MASPLSLGEGAGGEVGISIKTKEPRQKSQDKRTKTKDKRQKTNKKIKYKR